MDVVETQREMKRRPRSAPPSTTRRRRRLLEDHYRVDSNVVLPGVPKYDTNWARDAHDFFNLVVLVPVVALNLMNWNWDHLWTTFELASSWHGQWFEAFFVCTALYFVIDLLWILAVPHCVRSPSTIVQHHVATILYLLFPYYNPQYQWCMGACMSVEVNTWFLIARRVFNKQGFPPWILNLSVVSIRVKLISIFFYITWIGIRVILYPCLIPPFYHHWIAHSEKVGSLLNWHMLIVPLHCVFCALNLKWTYDLIRSKVRYWRRHAPSSVDKGL